MAHFQRTIGNNAVQRLLHTDVDAIGADPSGPSSSPSDHQDSRVPAEELPGPAKPAPIEAMASGPAIAALPGQGTPLPDPLRDLFEPQFGVDFGSVRLHEGPAAESLARTNSALAFTYGTNVVMGADAPPLGSVSGRRLLAHELTHVVQQRSRRPLVQRTIGDGHDLQSHRFAKNKALEAAYDPGEQNVWYGASGLHVRILQQALLDAGQALPNHGVDGDFKSETKAAVEGFQTSQGLSGGSVDGVVGPTTMGLLDAYFLDRSHSAAIAIGQTAPTAPTPNVPFPRGTAPAELLEGTRTLNAEERAAVERARTTEVQAPVGGTLPDFHLDVEFPVGSGTMENYEIAVRNRTRDVLNSQHARIGVPAAARMANPAAVYNWNAVHDIADMSKQETDRVFGTYAAGDAMRHGVNLGDAFEDKEADYTAGGAAFEDARVQWRVDKVVDGPDMWHINERHGAVASRSPESTHLGNVRSFFTGNAAWRQKLIEIDHGWPAYADPATRTVYLQRLQAGTDAGNKRNLWRMFHTVIHEYLHTLEHPDYRAYYQSLGERRGGKTYREGMTEHFTKMVIATVNYDAALRAAVEGAYHDPLNDFTIPGYGGYHEQANADAVIGIVGLRNAMAAYFLGEVQFLGGPP